MKKLLDIAGTLWYGDWDEIGEEWDGRVLLDYEDRILGAMVKNRVPEEAERFVEMQAQDPPDNGAPAEGQRRMSEPCLQGGARGMEHGTTMGGMSL